MKTIGAILFAALMGVTFVGPAFAADAAKPPQANTATVTNANKPAGTKVEKKHVRHHKTAGKSHMKEGKKEEKKM